MLNHVEITRGHWDVKDVRLNGSPLRLMPGRSSRSIWTDEIVVVKVDQGTPQAQREAETWLTLSPEDRQYFAALLAVGANFVVQEFVPLCKGEDGEAWELADKLFMKYTLAWDWQGWNQFGVDLRTGLLCIHDYPCDEYPGESYSWETLNLTRAA